MKNLKNIMKTKTPIKNITKDELIRLYFNENKNLDEIGTFFGYSDRQPIMRLFKKYNIKSRSKSELVKMRHPIPSKEDLLCMLNGISILTLSKKIKVHRGTIASWMAHHDIKSTYFINQDKDLTSSEYDNMSPKEISMKLGVPIDAVKYYRKSFTIKEYDRQTVIDKISEYGYDTNSKGFSCAIEQADANLYNSIIRLTNNHILQSDKFTERIYRLINNYTPTHVDICKCGNILKFYTFVVGYGNSSHKICLKCNRSINGVSLVSQKLFWCIFNKLNETEKSSCFFDKLNTEKWVGVNKVDKQALSSYYGLNKRFYLLDFVLNKKVIEFDGTYYHRDIIKEQAKDAFLHHKGYEVLHIKESDYYDNPEQVLHQCLHYLKQ